MLNAWLQVLDQIAQRQSRRQDMVAGSVRFCCKLLDTPELRHFHSKCLQYDTDTSCDSSAQSLSDIYHMQILPA